MHLKMGGGQSAANPLILNGRRFGKLTRRPATGIRRLLVESEKKAETVNCKPGIVTRKLRKVLRHNRQSSAAAKRFR